MPQATLISNAPRQRLVETGQTFQWSFWFLWLLVQHFYKVFCWWAKIEEHLNWQASLRHKVFEKFKCITHACGQLYWAWVWILVRTDKYDWKDIRCQSKGVHYFRVCWYGHWKNQFGYLAHQNAYANRLSELALDATFDQYCATWNKMEWLSFTKPDICFFS